MFFILLTGTNFFALKKHLRENHTEFYMLIARRFDWLIQRFHSLENILDLDESWINAGQPLFEENKPASNRGNHSSPPIEIPIKSLRDRRKPTNPSSNELARKNHYDGSNKAGRNKTTKHAFRDALKRAGLFSNVNDIRTKEWTYCLKNPKTPMVIEGFLNLRGVSRLSPKDLPFQNCISIRYIPIVIARRFDWLIQRFIRKSFILDLEESWMNAGRQNQSFYWTIDYGFVVRMIIPQIKTKTYQKLIQLRSLTDSPLHVRVLY